MLPAIVILLLVYGGYRAYPKPETPDQELMRLDDGCAALRASVISDRKALMRAENHITLVKRRGLRPAAIRQLMLPVYALRRRIEETQEQIAATEQRLAILKGEP